jgi:Peptidase family M41
MTRKERKLRATAYHEAGHAVAAWKFGLRFKHVTIKAQEDTLGHMLHGRSPKWFRPDCDNSDRTRLRAERRIITSLAGQLAEGKYYGRRPRFGMWGDNDSAVNMALHLCGSAKTTSAYLNFCFHASGDLVNTFWREIRAVAKALLKRETLSYDDTLEVIMPGMKDLRLSFQGAAAKMKATKATQKRPTRR